MTDNDEPRFAMVSIGSGLQSSADLATDSAPGYAVPGTG
eukprot:SAG31_NODE_3129_length_4646_cov_2.581262_1_plen_38_part_10